jgi:hypothetical protein
MAVEGNDVRSEQATAAAALPPRLRTRLHSPRLTMETAARCELPVRAVFDQQTPAWPRLSLARAGVHVLVSKAGKHAVPQGLIFFFNEQRCMLFVQRLLHMSEV